MRRYVLTGAPGAGRTSILRCLDEFGHGVVEEAATAVIARVQALGEDQPWTDPSFIDEIVALQRQSEATGTGGQVVVTVETIEDRTDWTDSEVRFEFGREVGQRGSAAAGLDRGGDVHRGGGGLDGDSAFQVGGNPLGEPPCPC